MSHYQRIACLSTEAVETLYALGAEEYIAGISGYTVHPARARTEKPKISGFSSAKIERILAVQPDLVVAFSDLQADIARELVSAGLEVHVFNHRNVEGIFRMIGVLAGFVQREQQGAALVADLRTGIAQAREQALRHERRPRVYFEEWNDPLMSGIGWVSELIGLAGGDDIFPELASQASGRERIIANPNEVARRAPDIIIGSWCGKKFQAESVKTRDGWSEIPAVRNDMIFEIKSPDILSPGPAAIAEGLAQLGSIVSTWHRSHPTPNRK